MTLGWILMAVVSIAVVVAPAVAQQAERSLIEIVLGADATASLHRGTGAPRVLHGRASAVTIDAGVADFSSPEARIDFGPDRELGFDSTVSFALDLWMRARPGGYQTPVMCRAGNAVAYTLSLGRSPGTVSFEAWSWHHWPARAWAASGWRPSAAAPSG